MPSAARRRSRLRFPDALRALFVLGGLLALGATGVAAQNETPLARIEGFDGIEQMEVGRARVLYAAGAGDEVALEEAVRKAVAQFQEAADFFADQLGGDFRYTLALLSPRHWHRVSEGHALPWSSQEDRLVVVPVRADIELLLPANQDTARAQRVLDIISYHQLGHVVTAAYLHPTGFRGQTPVRWFDELLASYLGEWYMRENRPELAEFAEDLAWDVTRRTTPRFSSLVQYDEYHDGYLTSPGGAATLGWYQNTFNLEAADLYEEYGPEFIERVRSELPWVRLETWTTEMLLEELGDVAPEIRGWARELAEVTAPRYR